MWYTELENHILDKLVARSPLHFNMRSICPEFFIDQNQFYLKFHTPSHSILWQEIAVRQEVNNLESSVVVYKKVQAGKELAINLVL